MMTEKQKTDIRLLQALFNDARFEAIFNAVDRLHDAASSGTLAEVTNLSADEVIGWLKMERGMVENLGNAARITQGYNTRNEIRWLPTIDVADIQRQIDTLAQSYRLLDTQIQEANWLTDLIQD